MPRSKNPKAPSKTSKKVRRATSAPLAFRADKGKDKEAPAEDSKASKEESADTKSQAKEAEEPKAAEPKAEASQKAAAEEPAPPEAKPEATPDEPAFAELLHPKQIAHDKRSPSAKAPPPGLAPRGDARSFRRVGEEGEEFCLVYRHYSRLITRRGTVGQEGTWTVVEYPNDRAAAHAYANACSTIGGEGFYDFRG